MLHSTLTADSGMGLQFQESSSHLSTLILFQLFNIVINYQIFPNLLCTYKRIKIARYAKYLDYIMKFTKLFSVRNKSKFCLRFLSGKPRVLLRLFGTVGLNVDVNNVEFSLVLLLCENVFANFLQFLYIIA